jgi:molybdopterin-containing oxidoreductase family iron-sulfur binding subunit
VHAPSVPPETPGLTLVLYPKLSQLDGRHAHNPWLQELPDPVSKVSWDNYACLSPARAETLGVADGDLVRLSVGEGEILELAVLVQRGQHDDVVAVALGYGRIGTDRFAGVGPDWLEGKPTVEAGGVVGVRAANCINLRAGNLRYDVPGLAIEPIGGRRDLASTQDHHTMVVPAHLAPAGGEVRDAVRTAVFADFKHDPEHALSHGHHFPEAELWEDDHDAGGHRWGMAVDLTSCIGCAACAIGCQAENNVPVVGKDEVLRHREMHWMRIDRYFSGEGDDVTAAHQPMFCQQCDNAPCESVCPVLATVHSSEGLNQQVYNRCVGTRYCANTCPYKVRRFNWFDYPREDELANQVLNPDVTVRTRGVMEKCSFCAQRIQEAKSEAIRRGTPLLDGDIQVACQQSCPTRAIEFGDLADPESRVSKLAERRRSYRVLEELNVKPSVNYLARIRNQEPESGHHDG